MKRPRYHVFLIPTLAFVCELPLKSFMGSVEVPDRRGRIITHRTVLQVLLSHSCRLCHIQLLLRDHALARGVEHCLSDRRVHQRLQRLLAVQIRLRPATPDQEVRIREVVDLIGTVVKKRRGVISVDGHGV